MIAIPLCLLFTFNQIYEDFKQFVRKELKSILQKAYQNNNESGSLGPQLGDVLWEAGVIYRVVGEVKVAVKTVNVTILYVLKTRERSTIYRGKASADRTATFIKM